MTTAEEFFRNKIKEQSPGRAVITLSNEIITAEQAMKWAHEFNLKKNEEAASVEVFDAEKFLNSKDIWNHPRVSDRNEKNSFEVADLMAEFANKVIKNR